MSRDIGIADRLRAAGLKVVEVDGWRERGSATFSPRGSVDHHTAGGRSGNAPSLKICINGRSDLPGPLCNVLIGRDNTCYVVAAGRANHAGKGSWGELSGNSSVYGIERENVGTQAEPWRPDQTETAARAHSALIRGKATAAHVCEHKEWAPTRKSDAHTIAGASMRSLIKRYLAGDPPAAPIPEEEDDMPKTPYVTHLNNGPKFLVHEDAIMFIGDPATASALEARFGPPIPVDDETHSRMKLGLNSEGAEVEAAAD